MIKVYKNFEQFLSPLNNKHMNWKLILRNGVWGYLLALIPFLVIPYVCNWVSGIIGSPYVPFGIGLISMFTLVIIVFTTFIPYFSGYHSDKERKKMQVKLVQFLVFIAILLSLWIIMKIDFYKI